MSAVGTPEHDSLRDTISIQLAYARDDGSGLEDIGEQIAASPQRMAAVLRAQAGMIHLLLRSAFSSRGVGSLNDFLEGVALALGSQAPPDDDDPAGSDLFKPSTWVDRILGGRSVVEATPVVSLCECGVIDEFDVEVFVGDTGALVAGVKRSRISGEPIGSVEGPRRPRERVAQPEEERGHVPREQD